MKGPLTDGARRSCEAGLRIWWDQTPREEDAGKIEVRGKGNRDRPTTASKRDDLDFVLVGDSKSKSASGNAADDWARRLFAMAAG